jgi:hypothetical protein
MDNLETAALPLFGQARGAHNGVNCASSKETNACIWKEKKTNPKVKECWPMCPVLPAWNKLWTGYYNEECLSIKYDGQGNILARFIPRAEK